MLVCFCKGRERKRHSSFKRSRRDSARWKRFVLAKDASRRRDPCFPFFELVSFFCIQSGGLRDICTVTSASCPTTTIKATQRCQCYSIRLPSLHWTAARKNTTKPPLIAHTSALVCQSPWRPRIMVCSSPTPTLVMTKINS